MKKKNITIQLIAFGFICFFCCLLKVQALDEGIYIIHSAINENYVLDANGGIAQNGTNVQLFAKHTGLSQKWIVKKLDGNYYQITSAINENYALDINGGIFNNSTNIQLWTKNYGTAQKWMIKEENGYYKLVAYNENYALDANSGIANNFTNIQLWGNNTSYAQLFRFEKYADIQKSVDNGIYTISSVLDSTKGIDVYGAVFKEHANIQLYNAHGSDAQKYYIDYLNNGYYAIKSYSNMNYALNVSSSGNVELTKYNGSNSQQWLIKDSGNGDYNIISKQNGAAIDIHGASTNNETNIETFSYHNGVNQRYILNKVDLVGSNTIDNGYYFITTSLNGKKVIDVNEAAMQDKTNVQIFDLNYGMAQKWYIEYLNNGYYKILCNKDKNYSLQADGNNINIGQYNGSDSQQWMIRKVDNGYYIISKEGTYVDLYWADTNNRTNIQPYIFTGSNAQKFTFKKTADGISEGILNYGMYTITSKLNNNLNVDLNGGVATNGTNIQLWYKNSSNAQKFYAAYDNGYYKLISVVDISKVFDVYYASSEVGANVSISGDTKAINQQWLLKDAGDGYFYIISNCSGLYLDAEGAYGGANVYMNEFTGSDSQKFKFQVTRIEKLVIDVSAWNGDIDWETVANYGGIAGAIIRVSAGTVSEDTKLAQNIAGVKKYNIPYGLYTYNYATDYTEGAVYGDFINNVISKYDLNPTLGVYFDLENNSLTSWMGPEHYTEVVRGFLDRYPYGKLYTYLNYANTALNNDYLRSKITWIAQYNVQCNYTGYYNMWQFTSSGQIPGISGNVDLSYYYIY